MNGEQRTLHLLGATGTSRLETKDGKEWLVIPVVALMEGVIHAVNAATPEFVPLETLKAAAASWNGKPITLGHPKRGGKQCSAEAPDIIEAHGIGVIKNSRVEGTKLLQEAWVEVARAKKLHPEMYARLAADKTEEVSVGAFVITDGVAGMHGPKAFKASWSEAAGDHLAFLPGGRGACSVEMGCGTHRAAMHFVAAESIDLLPGQVCEAFTTLEDEALDERMNAVHRAVAERWKTEMTQTVSSGYPIQIYDDRTIVRVNDEVFSVDYHMKDGKAILGEPKKVKQQWVEAAAKYAECETCDGTGQVKDGKGQKDCPSCEGEGRLRAAAGARHSAADTKMIQTMHDHSVSLGAKCDRGNFETLGDAPGHPFRGNQYKDGDSVIVNDKSNHEYHGRRGTVVGRNATHLQIKYKTPKVGAGRTETHGYFRPEHLSILEAEEQKPRLIKYEGGKYVLYSQDGSRRLAEHTTLKDAEAHAQAIEQVLGGKKAS